MDHGVRERAHPGGDDRPPRGHGLEGRAAGFVRARSHEDEHVEGSEHRRQVGIPIAGEEHPALEAEPFDESLERIAPLALPDQQQPRVTPLCQDQAEALDEGLVTPAGSEPRDAADERDAGRPELLPDLCRAGASVAKRAASTTPSAR